MRGGREDGFTLLEVATATLILAVVAAGVAALAESSVRGLTHSRLQTTTAILAQSVAERIEGGLSSSSGTAYFDQNGGDVGGSVTSTSVFVVRWSTGPAPSPAGMQTFEVTATALAVDRLRPSSIAVRLPDEVVMVGALRGGP